jgi:hypothetical protein
MDRRESLKSLLIGSVAGGVILTGCTPDSQTPPAPLKAEANGYGRNDHEKAHDEKVNAEIFLNEHELETVAVLCDIILPATTEAGSASEAGVPEFIEFIVKDMPAHQLPMRGGIAWLDNYSNATYGNEFKSLTVDQQKEICNAIAYPRNTRPEHLAGEKFFTRMRNLTLTGYYTSEMGIKDLGYKGNTPNTWDGVPEEILSSYSVTYEKEWMEKCIDPTKRDQIAQWDEEGNLI